jgi:rare lipoprotein A
LLLAGFAAPALAQGSGGIEASDSLLNAKPSTLGSPVSLTGMLAGSGSGRRAEIQIQGRSGAWLTVARGPAARDGSFKLSWRAPKSGRFLARAVTAGAHKSELAATPTTVITVHNKTQATWYDQAGTTSACGVKLRKTTLGVAHKTLPCGTRLDFSFRGKSITIPVIDRGPFVNGVSYDLTIEVARRLGFVNTGRGAVGVLRSGTKLSKLSAAQLPGAIPAAS